jgi:hypothetical protein
VWYIIDPDASVHNHSFPLCVTLRHSSTSLMGQTTSITNTDER